MMDATEITEVTPITIPRIVSPERTLREPSVSKATSRFSFSSAAVMSIAPQRRHRIEPRCLHCRIDAEKHPDRRTEKYPQQSHPRPYRRRKGGKRAQPEGA